jgi:hypothetical protein
MDYSGFRRSDNIDWGGVNQKDADLYNAYKGSLQAQGLDPTQVIGAGMAAQSYVPTYNMNVTPQQMASPLGQSLGIQDINPLVEALRRQAIVNQPAPDPNGFMNAMGQ